MSNPHPKCIFCSKRHNLKDKPCDELLDYFEVEVYQPKKRKYENRSHPLSLHGYNLAPKDSVVPSLLIAWTLLAFTLGVGMIVIMVN